MTHRRRSIPVAPGQMTMDTLFVVLLPNGRSLTLLAGGRSATPEPGPAAPVALPVIGRRAAA